VFRLTNTGSLLLYLYLTTSISRVMELEQRMKSTLFSTGGTRPPLPHFFGLKFVQKLVHCCNWLLTEKHTNIHPFNGPFSGTTQVRRYQKGKTNLDFTEARDSEWQWHQLVHMQVCTSLQIDNHASTPPFSFYRPDALPVAQPTASKH